MTGIIMCKGVFPLFKADFNKYALDGVWYVFCTSKCPSCSNNAVDEPGRRVQLQFYCFLQKWKGFFCPNPHLIFWTVYRLWTIPLVESSWTVTDLNQDDFIYFLVTILMGGNWYWYFFSEFSRAEHLPWFTHWVCLHRAFWFVLGDQKCPTSHGGVRGQASRMETCSTVFKGSLTYQQEIQTACNSLIIQREPVVQVLCRQKTSETSDSAACRLRCQRGGCAVRICSSSKGCTRKQGWLFFVQAQQRNSEKLGGKNQSRATTRGKITLGFAGGGGE